MTYFILFSCLTVEKKNCCLLKKLNIDNRKGIIQMCTWLTWIFWEMSADESGDRCILNVCWVCCTTHTHQCQPVWRCCVKHWVDWCWWWRLCWTLQELLSRHCTHTHIYISITPNKGNFYTSSGVDSICDRCLTDEHVLSCKNVLL